MAKYSLHIGVNVTDREQYPQSFPDLTGAVPDARALERLAAGQGFTTQRLEDSSATAEGVLSEIRSLASTMSAGDLLLLTYSGHGSQYEDQEDDEADGRDETWVLHDRQLLDDELRHAWTRFPSGTCVLLLSDSCHSGTVLRIDRPPALAPAADALPARSRKMPSEARIRDVAERSALYRGVKAGVPRVEPQDVSASVIQFGACHDDEEAYELAGQGVMTRAFIEVFDDGGFRGDHTAFFTDLARLVTERQPRQHPTYVTHGPDDLAFSARRPLTTPEEP